MNIVNVCSVSSDSRGGKWFTDHIMYVIRFV